jgi:hypothetical protein
VVVLLIDAAGGTFAYFPAHRDRTKVAAPGEYPTANPYPRLAKASSVKPMGVCS